jgi:DNA-binding beta-propeller fold protein YncE
VDRVCHRSRAVTPDGKLAIVAAPTRYDYAGKKELFDNFLQLVDIESTPPKLLGRIDVGAHTNGLTINREGTLLLAAGLDGNVKVLAIDGKNMKLIDTVKVGEKRLSGISFTHDGKAAIVAQRDENGAAVLSVDGASVKLTNEKISTGVTPYAVDVSSDGKWIVVSSMAGSNLTPDNPGRNKLGKLALFAIQDGVATRVNEVPGAEAAQGVVFTQDSKTILVQFDVERALAVYAIRDGKLVDSGARIKLAAGPVSIRSTPR